MKLNKLKRSPEIEKNSTFYQEMDDASYSKTPCVPELNEAQTKNLIKWLIALEEGDYSQGSSYLKIPWHSSDNDAAGRKDQFCCLGVALNELDENGWGHIGGNSLSSDYTFRIDGNVWEDNNSTANDLILIYYGIMESGCEFLACKNDEGVWRFHDIALEVRTWFGIQDLDLHDLYREVENGSS